MVHAYRPSIAKTAEWMTKLRAAVGLGPVLGVEYHHRLSVAEAASFCQRMPSGTLSRGRCGHAISMRPPVYFIRDSPYKANRGLL